MNGEEIERLKISLNIAQLVINQLTSELAVQRVKSLALAEKLEKIAPENDSKLSS